MFHVEHFVVLIVLKCAALPKSKTELWSSGTQRGYRRRSGNRQHRSRDRARREPLSALQTQFKMFHVEHARKDTRATKHAKYRLDVGATPIESPSLKEIVPRGTRAPCRSSTDRSRTATQSSARHRSSFKNSASKPHKNVERVKKRRSRRK